MNFIVLQTLILMLLEVKSQCFRAELLFKNQFLLWFISQFKANGFMKYNTRKKSIMKMGKMKPISSKLTKKVSQIIWMALDNDDGYIPDWEVGFWGTDCFFVLSFKACWTKLEMSGNWKCEKRSSWVLFQNHYLGLQRVLWWIQGCIKNVGAQTKFWLRPP
jgi:hypothetical protein